MSITTTALDEHRRFLRDRSPKELRQLAAQYGSAKYGKGIKITGRAGNTLTRIGFFAFCSVLVLTTLALAVSFVPVPTIMRVTLAVGIWAEVAIYALWRWFSIVTPKLAANILTNFVTGRMHVTLPGINVRFPWERHDRNLDRLSQRSGEIKKESTFLSKDGIPVTFKHWTVQWGPFLPLLPLNIRYKTTDVSASVVEIVESTLYEEILKRTVAEIRTPETVDAIEEELLDAMAGVVEKHRDKFGNTIEERFGISLEIVALGTIKLDEDYEQSLRADVIAQRVKKNAKELVDELGLEGSEAINNVLILNKEQVKRDIFTIEAAPRVEKVAEQVGTGLKGLVSGLAKVTGGSPPKNGGKPGG